MIAAVILNYNGKAHLEKFLPGVIQFSPEAKIVVADNGSTDDSIAFISKNFPGVEIIGIGKNLGFCGGYNYALKKVVADYFVLLNNDVEVTDGWLKPMRDLLDRDTTIAAVQPKVLSWHHKNKFEYAGAGGGMIDMLGYPFCRGRIFDSVEEDQGQYNDTLPVFWATGACLVVRAGLFMELGGFDEDFFAHMEEIDLCWQLKRRGHQVYYCGSSTVYHVGGGTLAMGNPAKTYYNFRNGLAILIKHQRWGQLLWKFPLRVGLDWVAALKFLMMEPAHAWAVIRAHGYVATHFGRILKKRAVLKGYTFDVGGIYPGSILWRYFVLGRKTFQ
ncbi:MAG TPA: glycosyltransferase family 2 protein [Cyclobacteriaceae bacterium]